MSTPLIPLPGLPSPTHLWDVGDDVKLAGDSWGDPDAPLVILLHGVGQTRNAWSKTAKLLGEAGYHAITYDARGHGDSSWAPDGEYSREIMVRDLQRLIEQFGRSPSLVGASMGGITSMIGIGTGLIHADSLILVDIAARTEPFGVGRVFGFMRDTASGFHSLEEAADVIDAYRPRERKTRNLDGLAKNLRKGRDGKFYWHWDPRLLGRERGSEEQRVNAARNLRVPTLLVRGGHSDVVSEENAQDFLKLCPHAEYVSIVGASHMVSGDRNDVFGEAALGFLRRVVARQEE